MNANPYQSPSPESILAKPQPVEKIMAQRSIHWTLLIMVLPAIYNFICFSFPASSNQIRLPIPNVFRIVNGTGLLVTFVAIWFLGLLLLEFLTGAIYAIFGRNCKLDDWKMALYRSLSPLPLFAVVGAVLWAIWVMAFYQMGFDFYTISVPIGIAAHLLAAGLYVPLFSRWYKLERSAATQITE